MFEQRQEIQADLVAQHVGLKVGGVCDVILTDGIEILQDLLTADTEQGTDDMTVTGTDARQSMDACPTEEVHEQRLNGIVPMMGHADCLGTKIITQLIEITIAQFAGSHFNAYLMKISIFNCIKVD